MQDIRDVYHIILPSIFNFNTIVICFAMRKRKSIRLRGYDYSQRGFYFVTIVVQDRLNLFGEIMDGKMIQNDAGKMIKKWYLKLEDKFSGIKCDEYIVMPNHFHCLIEIHSNVGADPCVRPCVQPTKRPSLSQIIQWFKTMTTNDYIKFVKNNHWQKFNRKLWERSFIDRILRNNDIDIKRQYIKDNPKNWKQN